MEKQSAKDQILKQARKLVRFTAGDIIMHVGDRYTRQYISTLLTQLVHEGTLTRTGRTRDVVYAIPGARVGIRVVKKKLKNSGLREDDVMRSIEAETPLLANLGENIGSILFYAFTEMFNNAIEHSHSKYIEYEFSRAPNSITFVVNDFGIGVFRSVMRKRKLKEEIEAIQDIMKGKTTTKPKAHSGEGIFFTSKIADVFLLESYGYRLRIDNLVDDIFVERLDLRERGTRVTFVINSRSKKHLSTLFRRFQSDPDAMHFDKTEIKVKLYIHGTIYISRSQARRLLTGLDRYKKVILDFDRVPTVGQAFADEVFRVFRDRHPDITITAINMVEPVQFMVERAKNRK